MSTITGTFDNVNVGRTVLNSSSVLNVNGNVSVHQLFDMHMFSLKP